MTLLEPGRTTLRNVLVYDSRGDPLAAKINLSRLLAAADIRAAGLPPGAVLVVRHLDDPLPGKLRLGRGELAPPPAWERAMQAALETQVRRAARPAFAHVPADAPAVLFADHAELLACLAGDWLKNCLPENWWWRSLFPNADLPKAALAAWRESPEELPAALELLARRRQAPAFIRVLGVEITRQMLGGVLHRFGLNSLQQVFGALPGALAPTEQNRLASPVSSFPTAPWHLLVPESGANGLSIDQQALLGIGLSLQRASALVRSSGFSHSADAWRQAFLLQQNTGPVKTRGLHRPGKSADNDSVSPAGAEPAPFVPARAAAGPADTPDKQRLEVDIDLATDSPSAGESALLLSSPAAADLIDRPEVDIDQRSRRTSVGESVPLIPSRAAANLIDRPEGQGLEVDHDQRSRRTSVGESVPLIPSRAAADLSDRPEGQRLEVDHDPSPAGMSDGVSGWTPDLEYVPVPATPTTTELLAAPALEEAPLAETVFTQFGGLFYLLNVAQALGLYGDFSTPLSPGLALSPWDFLALVGREMIGSELEADPLWELLRRLAGRQPDQPPGWGFEPPDGAPLDDWLRQTVLQFRASLLPALSLEDPADLGNLLCAHPARILLSSARLDITFSLAEHPIIIRLAGLDRDPGWIPAAGHYVVYYYD